METKQYMETWILLWVKWIDLVEIKHKDFIDVVPLVPSL